MESRVQRAVTAFESGYNCAQSVFATYADLVGMDRQTALKLSSAMGAGVGRMREICGTVSGMALLAGLKEGNVDPEDEDAKEHIYARVQEMSAAFHAAQGSLICRELLAAGRRTAAGELSGDDKRGCRKVERESGDLRMDSPRPEKRTKEYYASRPCSRLVACAAGLVEQKLLPELFKE